MAKYKIVGIINLLFGLPLLLLTLTFSIFVIPKIVALYSEVNANASGNVITSYLVVLILFVLSLVNIFLGIKCFFNNPKKDSYFKYALITILITFLTFLLSGALIGFMSFSVISPIYNLTSSF